MTKGRSPGGAARADRQDGPDGDWGFEAEGPSTLLRAGIKVSLLKPGEQVTVKGHPLRDGRPAALLVSVTKADGSVLGSDLQRSPRAGWHASRGAVDALTGELIHSCRVPGATEASDRAALRTGAVTGPRILNRVTR